MIDLWFSNGKIYVWNVEDIFVLRKEHRIVGSLVGHYPIKPFQVQKKWLPLKLLPEEARLLIDKGFAQMMSVPERVEDPAVIEKFYATQDKLCEEQVVLLKENRKQEILEKANVIYEGKKRKFMEGLEKKKKAKQNLSDQPQQSNKDISADDQSNSAEAPTSATDCKPNSPNPLPQTESNLENNEMKFPITKEEMIAAMFAQIPDTDKEFCMIQLFTECPWKKSNPVENWKYPYTQVEKLRYAVFKDLWENGYYITTAMKFGGDFLAYEGDPLKFHALFIVVCLDSTQRFRGHDLVVYGRLGQNVKKTVALASLNEAGEVEYISINWNHEML